MKKLVVMVCLLAITVGVRAQFEKGKWLINTSLTEASLSYSKAEDFHLGIMGQGGTFVADNFAVMATVGADWKKAGDTYTLGMGGRYYFDLIGVYVGGGLKVKRWDGGGQKYTDLAWYSEAGYAFFLSRSVTIEPAIYYDLSFKDNDYSRFGVKVGFSFYF